MFSSLMVHLNLFSEFKMYPPAQNQNMQEKILGELNFARVHAGPVFALARIQANIFQEVRSMLLPADGSIDLRYPPSALPPECCNHQGHICAIGTV